MKKLMENWRSFEKQVLNEQDDWYSEEHETLADKKFAERGTDLSPEEEMEKYLIDKGVYKGGPGGRILIMTGIVGEAREVLEASGQFEQRAIDIFINKLHELVR